MLLRLYWRIRPFIIYAICIQFYLSDIRSAVRFQFFTCFLTSFESDAILHPGAIFFIVINEKFQFIFVHTKSPFVASCSVAHFAMLRAWCPRRLFWHLVAKLCWLAVVYSLDISGVTLLSTLTRCNLAWLKMIFCRNQRSFCIVECFEFIFEDCSCSQFQLWLFWGFTCKNFFLYPFLVHLGVMIGEVLLYWWSNEPSV